MVLLREGHSIRRLAGSCPPWPGLRAIARLDVSSARPVLRLLDLQSLPDPSSWPLNHVTSEAADRSSLCGSSNRQQRRRSRERQRLRQPRLSSSLCFVLAAGPPSLDGGPSAVTIMIVDRLVEGIQRFSSASWLSPAFASLRCNRPQPRPPGAALQWNQGTPPFCPQSFPFFSLPLRSVVCLFRLHSSDDRTPPFRAVMDFSLFGMTGRTGAPCHASRK